MIWYLTSCVLNKRLADTSLKKARSVSQVVECFKDFCWRRDKGGCLLAIDCKRMLRSAPLFLPFETGAKRSAYTGILHTETIYDRVAAMERKYVSDPARTKVIPVMAIGSQGMCFGSRLSFMYICTQDWAGSPIGRVPQKDPLKKISHRKLSFRFSANVSSKISSVCASHGAWTLSVRKATKWCASYENMYVLGTFDVM